nr:bacteriohemerythrin [uncultured Holophaga sp.]
MTFDQDSGSTLFLIWEDRYRVGQARVDQEHERLAFLIAHLHETMIVRRDKAVSLQLFERLILETRRHFDTEAALMEEFAYPDQEAHLREHGLLLEEASRLAHQYQQGHISALALPGFLKKWLLLHIDGPDRACVAYLKSQGL